jgi:hypothetical protein
VGYKVPYLNRMMFLPQTKQYKIKHTMSSYIFIGCKIFNKNTFKMFLSSIFVNAIFYH